MKILDIPQSGKRGLNVSQASPFGQISRTLAQFGQEQVDAPPAHPQFPDLAPTNLAITNIGGVIAVKLTCPTDPGENTIVRGSAPLSQGRETCRDFRILGTCPAAVAGSADITTLYTARYGVPPVGKKVYVWVNQFVDGWEAAILIMHYIGPPGVGQGHSDNCWARFGAS